MTHHHQRVLAVAIAGCAVSWLLPATRVLGGSLDGPTKLPDHVRKALESNARGLGPTTVVYDTKRTTPVAAGQLSKKLNFVGPSEEFVKEQTVQYLWQDGMTYSRTRTSSFVRKSTGPVSLDQYRQDRGAKAKTPAPPKDPNEPRVKTVEIQEIAVNKTDYYSGTGEELPRTASGNEPTVILSIQPLDLARTKLRGANLVRPEYFFESGFVLPSKPGDQGHSQASLVLVRLDSAGDRLTTVEQTEFDGNSCLLVVTEAKDRRYRFYLDPKLGYAVRRREEQTADGRVLARSDGSNFKRDGSSETWLPHHILVTHYRWPISSQTVESEALVNITFDVKELDHEPIPPEKFQIKYRKAGAYISDATLPGASALPGGKVSYRMPADPANLDAAIKSAMRGENPDRVFGRMNFDNSNRTVLAFVLGNALVVSALAIWLYRRGRRDRAKTSGKVRKQ